MAFLVKPLKGKRFPATLLSHSERASSALWSQGTVTQPTMRFKCFPLFGFDGKGQTLLRPFTVGQLLFSLI
jgi:hypothetical protein